MNARPEIVDRSKRVIRELLYKLGIHSSFRLSRKNRRYPYTGRRKMLHELGPQLASSTNWAATDGELIGPMAAVFEDTDRVHKLAHYLPIYESLLDRDRPIRMLEIGVFHGGSLRMWRKYLHPDSKIVGIDINPECGRFEDSDENIYVRIGRQENVAFLSDVIAEFGPFDFILDDGSHMSSHMIESFRYLFPNALTDNGVYMVEDVVCDYWTEYRDRRTSFIDFVRVLVDAMHAHYQVVPNEAGFRVGNPERIGGVQVPQITPMLHSIEIYDSVVVVRRGNRELTRSIYRG